MNGAASGYARCPGEGRCEIWDVTAGTFEEKKKVCLDCRQCRGNPPFDPHEAISPDAEALVISVIESLVMDATAGLTTDPNELEIADFELLKIWRMQERFHDLQHKANLQALIAAMSNNGK